MARLLSLDSALPVLLRPDGVVQVGWDPRRAVTVQPPDGLTTSALADILRSMQVPVERAELHRQAAAHGLTDRAAFDDMLAGLIAAGLVRSRHRRKSLRALSIRLHGCGPLSDVLVDTLHRSGARIAHTSHAQATAPKSGVDLVVLSDYLVSDPRLIRDLHSAGLPHLAVRVRDGVGLVGPLVIPGVTSCLACVDLHRADRDAAWPVVAAQLRDVIGSADRPTVLATAALALSQVQRIIVAVRGEDSAGRPPATLDNTLEIDVNANTIKTRHWPLHPLCDCSDWSGDRSLPGRDPRG